MGRHDGEGSRRAAVLEHGGDAGAARQSAVVAELVRSSYGDFFFWRMETTDYG